MPDRLHVYVDSDHAGCLKTRKSTSGGVLSYGGAVVKAYSKTQPNIALTVGEGEFVAMSKAATEAVGLRSLLKDLGVEGVVLRLSTDSATAKSITSRRGVGRVRHIDTHHLWLQASVRRGEIRLIKVPGTRNAADILTKAKSLRSSSRN